MTEHWNPNIYNNDQDQLPEEPIWIEEYQLFLRNPKTRLYKDPISLVVYDELGNTYERYDDGNWYVNGKLDNQTQLEVADVVDHEHHENLDAQNSVWVRSELRKKIILSFLSISIVSAAFIFWINKDSDEPTIGSTPFSEPIQPFVAEGSFSKNWTFYTGNTVGTDAEPLLLSGQLPPCGNLESIDPNVSKGDMGWGISNGETIISCNPVYDYNTGQMHGWTYAIRIYTGIDRGGGDKWSDSTRITIQTLDELFDGEYCETYPYVNGCNFD